MPQSYARRATYAKTEIDACRLYVQAGLSVQQIAERFGEANSAIHKMLKDCGIKANKLKTWAV